MARKNQEQVPLDQPFGMEHVALLIGLVFFCAFGLYAFARIQEVPAWEMPEVKEQVYKAPNRRYPRMLDSDGSRAWMGGRDPFIRAINNTRGVRAELPVPPSPSYSLALPSFDPWLPYDRGNGQIWLDPNDGGPKVPAPNTGGTMSINPESIDFPTPMIRIPDRREEKVRPNDVISTKAPAVFEGEILYMDDEEVKFLRKEGGQVTIPRKEIVEIQRAYTFEEWFHIRLVEARAKGTRDLKEVATWARESGMLEEAALAVEEWITRQPDRIEPRLMLANLYRQSNRLNKELVALRSAVEDLSLDREDIWTRIGVICRKLGLDASAVGAFEQALVELPNAVEPRLGLAEIAAEQGDLESLGLHVDRILLREPVHVDALILKATSEIMFGRPSQARNVLTGIEDGATDARVQNLLGVISFAQGDYPSSLAAFERAVTLAPTNERFWINLGTFHLAAGSTTQARQVFAAIDRLNPAGVWGPLGQAVAGMLGAITDPDEVQKHIDEAMVRYPKHAYANYIRARFEGHANGDIPAAMASLKQAIHFNDSLWPAYLEYAWLAKRNGETEASSALLDLVERGAPKLSEGRRRLHQVLNDIELSNADEARTYLDFPKAIGDAIIETHLSRAWILYSLEGKVEEALVVLNAVEARDRSGTARRWANLIERAELQQAWIDRFNRGPAERVGNGWVEVEETGIAVKLSADGAIWSGTQSKEDQGVTLIERPVSGRAFREAVAIINPDGVGEASYGLRFMYFQSPNRANEWAVIRVKPDGSVEFGEANSDGNEEFETANVVVGNRAELRIFREAGDQRGRYDIVFMVNGTRLGKITVTQREISKNVNVGVFGQAPRGAEYTFRLDSVSVITQDGDDR